MKKLLYIVLSLILLVGVTSCGDWLDVNTDEDNPNNVSATENNRLPWIQYYYIYAWGTANTRASAIDQMVVGTSRTGTIGRQALWNPSSGVSTTVYQNWFVGAAANIPDLITKAQADGAYHYVGAALVIKSMGYIMMADLYGEMPYTDAVTTSLSPKYDTGDVIYNGCLADLDEAIKYFDMTQSTTAPSLAEGDCWNGGDVAKWKKLAYGLKARWLNNLSKTKSYDPAAILAALENAPQSNSDNIIMVHKNVSTSTYNFTTADAYGPNTTWDSMAWGTGQRLNKWYVDLLVNFKGTGVLDPRADKLIPSSMYKVTLKSDGSISSFSWLRDCGVNLSSTDGGWIGNRMTFGNLNSYLSMAKADVTKTYANTSITKFYASADDFIAMINKYYSADNVTVLKEASDVKVTYHAGAMYVNDVNPLYVEDIKYVQLRSDAVFETQGLSTSDECCYYSAAPADTRANGFVQGTGSFYARPDSDSDILTYSEMCFIKAEVYFRQGKLSDAYTAYINGIKANFERMNSKLSSWKGAGACKTALGYDVTFAYGPMAQADIDAYMTSAAVKQSAASLTLSDIMMQKFIAMGPNYQNYNDMRRYNYYAGNIGNYGVIYTQLAVPVYRTQDQATFSADPQNVSFYPRRWMQCSHETNYNSTNLNEITQKLYNISAQDKSIWSIPVWWDAE
ncbi:MAG: SusD/RagB family nutrient-binding outer membrane lipoprotein [Bacteroidales bacterium]|jgi:hypothetical protein|nr:SusD/RagB family nutrient-binding outer membrane lipoprotein [Bacteroidales bacterium]